MKDEDHLKEMLAMLVALVIILVFLDVAYALFAAAFEKIPDLASLPLKTVLMTIGFWFSNPFVPDFGTQFITAFAIGMILPPVMVEPLNQIVLGVPFVDRFQKKLKKHRRFRTIIPRIFAGYVITYAIGWSLLAIAYFFM